jgi:hypothetical protein
MRVRVLVVLIAVLALQAVGCSRLCRCCGRNDLRNDRIPPPALNDRLPLPTSPSVPSAPASSAKPTGAYGGSGE